MTCHSLQVQISAYADGALERAERDEVERHLAVCSSCEKAYRRIVAFNRFMAECDEPLTPPDAIWERIENRLGGSEKSLPDKTWGKQVLVWFQVPALRYALPVFLIAGLLVLAPYVLDKGNDRSGEVGSLTALNEFTLEVEGNPFLPNFQRSNPFFQPSYEEIGNPFGSSRSQE